MNTDIQVGKLIAFAPNSAAMFIHTGIDPRTLPQDETREVAGADGNALPLPQAAALEEAVDRVMLNTIPGSNNTSVDGQNDPALARCGAWGARRLFCARYGGTWPGRKRRESWPGRRRTVEPLGMFHDRNRLDMMF